MNVETIIGLIILGAALLALAAFVVWSRWAINRIAQKDLKSVRDIVKDLKNGA